MQHTAVPNQLGSRVDPMHRTLNHDRIRLLKIHRGRHEASGSVQETIRHLRKLVDPGHQKLLTRVRVICTDADHPPQTAVEPAAAGDYFLVRADVARIPGNAAANNSTLIIHRAYRRS